MMDLISKSLFFLLSLLTKPMMEVCSELGFRFCSHLILDHDQILILTVIKNIENSSLGQSLLIGALSLLNREKEKFNIKSQNKNDNKKRN